MPPTSESGTAIGSPSVTIDRDAEVPIGVQLAWALRTHIRDGRFKPGERLPGLRDLAEAIGVNVNTVRAVYQRLEHEGLIDSRQGSGTFVASRPPAALIARARSSPTRRARRARSGFDPREVAAALYVIARASSPARRRRRAVRGRPETAAARPHRRVRASARRNGNGASRRRAVAHSQARGAGPALLSVEELEQVRSVLVRRLATVQAAIDALGRGDTSGEAEHQEERQAATTSKRAGGSPIGRTRGKTRPAPAGA